MKYEEMTEQILGAAFKVHKTLGFGFLEKVYQKALVIELKERGLRVKSESPIRVYYKDKIVGEYEVDLIIENKVIVELKAVEELNKKFEV